MVNEKNGSFSERVKEKINYQVKVEVVFPNKLYSRLKKFAKDETADCFWLSFEKLIDFYESSQLKDLNTIMLMERDDQLKVALEKLDVRVSQLEKPEDKKEKKSAHFGAVKR